MNREIRNHLISSIPEGAENAISMKNLAKRLDIGQRELRRLVMIARIEGNIILSNDDGYFTSHDRKDIRRYYQRIQNRQRSTAEALSAIRRELKKAEDDSEYQQLSLFGADYVKGEKDTV